jgi:RimJ/RimL family protein N-acetyltransferase
MIRLKFLHRDDISWADTEFIRTVRSHPLILDQVFHQKKITRVEQEDWFTHIYSRQPEYRIWLAYDSNRSAPFGYIQSWVDSIPHRRVQLYWIPSPDQFNESTYSALIKASMRQINLLEMDIRKVWAYVFPENEMLLGVLSDHGFEIDALLRDHCVRNGSYRDVQIVSKIVDISV